MSAAARQARRRQRERAGLVVITVELEELATAEAMEITARLRGTESECKGKLTAAIQRLINEWIGVVTRDCRDPLCPSKMPETKRN